jgi:hypothetical protein
VQATAAVPTTLPVPILPRLKEMYLDDEVIVSCVCLSGLSMERKTTRVCLFFNCCPPPLSPILRAKH